VRTLLLTGPGGAGTTTLAASAAVRSARSGVRTALLSRQAGPVPGLAAEPGLEVVRVDGRTALEQLWGGASSAVSAVLPQLTLPPASSVVPLPGTEDLALFAALARSDADLLVVDAGPLASAAALVSLPATLRWWLDQLMPPGMRALGAVRTAAVASGAVRRGPVDAALAAVPVVEDLLRRDRLTGAEVWLTAAPRAASVPAVRGTAATLALHGLRAAAVLARVLPADGAGEWQRARSAEQDAVLASLAEVAPVHRIPEGAVAHADVDQLAPLLADVDTTAPAAFPTPAPERHEGAWRLTLPLPFAERPAVHVTRWVDDLVVTVGGSRRSLRLDPLLRRCQVTGGRLADPGTAAARLEIGFRPDPQLWPADLLAAEGRHP
jgi:arsenite/tail-anchored protein-transporting ATPase